MKKGLSMPLEMIVVIAIAVLVLVVVAALFSSSFGSGSNTVSLEKALSDACQLYRVRYNCNPAEIVNSGLIKVNLPGETPTAAGNPHSLQQICNEKSYSTEECLKACGCNPV